MDTTCMRYKKIKKYKYMLAETLHVQTDIIGWGFKHEFFSLSIDGLLTIYKGYMWDGVSGPAWDTLNTMIAGCIHDALYQAIRLELIPIVLKITIDQLYKHVLLKEGVSRFRAAYHWLAVDTFGERSCVPGNIRIPEVLTA